MNCPACKSHKIIKNGSIHNGKQNFAVKIVEDNLLKIHKTKSSLKQLGIWLTNYYWKKFR